MFPQLAVGGCIPKPKKLRLASTLIAVASHSVATTRISLAPLGKTCLTRTLTSGEPIALAASMYVVSLMPRAGAFVVRGVSVYNSFVEFDR